MPTKHTNSGDCQKCNQIIDRYPGFYAPLRRWFKDFQKKNPACHTSCAGRGELDQEACFIRGASKAKWPESSHNWNAALDIFELQGDIENIYEESWYLTVLKPALPDWIEWYGEPTAKFDELPHIQYRNWRASRDKTLRSIA